MERYDPEADTWDLLDIKQEYSAVILVSNLYPTVMTQLNGVALFWSP